MPNQTPAIDPFWSGVIGAAGGLVGTAGNAIWQGAMNKKTRKWNEKMYYQQRADAISDWNRQNEYNSPAAVMARFKEAKLNPNLIYGQGNEGGTIRSSSVEGWNPRTSDISSPIGQMFMMMYDLAKTAQETSYIKAQEDLARQNEARARVLRDKDQLELDTEKVLYGTTLRKRHAEAYNAEIDSFIKNEILAQNKTQTEIQRVLKQNTIKKAMAEYNSILLAQAETRARTAKTNAEKSKIEQEISNLKTMGQILLSDKSLKQFEVSLSEFGASKSDNAIFRAIQGSFSEIFKRVLGNK